MKKPIPSAADVRSSMSHMTRRQLIALAAKTGVSFHTLQKIKTGETRNPAIDTVRMFWSAL
jgi:DNA-binding Xre family transcriptional regulator